MPHFIFRFSWLPLALAGLGLPSLPALAATRAVPGQFATIQAAINASVNGDVVLLADGTYSGIGNVDLDFGGKNITVTSQNGAASTIIDCQGTSASNHRGFNLYSGETNAVISGLTIENGYEYGDGGGIQAYNVGLTIQNCIIKNNEAVYGGGVYSFAGAGHAVVINNCAVTGNTSYSYGLGGGLFNTSTGSITVTNCTLTGNTATAGSSGTAPGGGIFNSTYSSGTITLTNDILYGDTGGEVPGTTVTHCDIQGGSAGTGNINADPLFSAAPSDLHLQAGSPCLGAGTPGGGAPTAALDGQMRPVPPSIGAYEAAAPVAQYTYATVDAPGAGSTYLTGINIFSQAVGYFTLSGSYSAAYAFLESGSVFTPENDPAGASPYTRPVGINDLGQIAGTYLGADGQFHGYGEAGGVFTTVDVPNSATRTITGINDAGQIVGSYTDTSNRSHGFVYARGTFTTVDAPNSTSTTLSGINNLGQLIGLYIDAKGYHSFVNTNGVYKEVVVPGASALSLSGINDLGQIVGASYDSSYRPHPFVDNGGVFTAISEPNASSGAYQPTVVAGINDAGQIVGSYYDAQYQSHGFIATPQIPFAPTGLAAAAQNGKITLSWTAPPGFVLGYSISRGTTPGGETGYKFVSTGTTFVDTGVKTGVAYYYTVKAINVEGTSPASNEAAATVAALPGSPGYIIVYASQGVITLKWATPTGIVTGYSIFRGTASGAETSYKSVGAAPIVTNNYSTNTYVDAAVTPGTTYYYIVKAVNSGGTGPTSYEASATP